jgi:hypothetical protein
MKFSRLIAPLLCLSLAVAGCNVFLPSQFQSNPQRETAAAPVPAKSAAAFEAAWVGKSASDVQASFGRPSRMESLEDTGGERYYYRGSGPHYIFEFDVHEKVTNAAVVD